MVGERWIIVTSAPCSQRSAATSWAELFGADDDASLARICRAVRDTGWNDAHAPEAILAPGISVGFGTPDMPVAKTSCAGFSVSGLAVALDLDGPAL